MTNSESGLPPFVGVIIMILLTVLLAVVIGVMILDLGASYEKETEIEQVSDSVEVRIDDQGVHVYRIGMANEIIVEEYKYNEEFFGPLTETIKTVKLQEEGSYNWSGEELNKFSRTEDRYYRAYVKSNSSNKVVFVSDIYNIID